jgi:hypothetical protein
MPLLVMTQEHEPLPLLRLQRYRSPRLDQPWLMQRSSFPTSKLHARPVNQAALPQTILNPLGSREALVEGAERFASAREFCL